MRGALTLTAVLALLIAAAPAWSAGRSALAGSWAGTMRPAGDAVERSYRFRLTIDRDGRRGTWRTTRCRGTLEFVTRSDGFTLLRERRTAGPCTGDGVDWVKRRGARLYVSFKSSAGRRYDSRGTLSRASR